MLVSNVPDPRRSIPQHDDPLGMLQTPAHGLGIDPHPESLGCFDRPHITGRVLIPNRLALLVQRGLRENSPQLSLAGLGLWVLLTRTALGFTGHYWNPGPIV